MEESQFGHDDLWANPGESRPAGGNNLFAFGVLAVEKGLVGWNEVGEALREQQKRRRSGQEVRIGEILHEKGLLTRGEITEIFNLQGALGGHTEIDGYEIIEEIGKGAMGRIFKALQTRMDRVVALKVITPRLAMDRKFVQRFLRESRLAAKLRHHNIVFIIDAGVSNGVHFYAMEYVEGKTLKDILAARGSLSEIEVVRLALHMSLALEHAHENGVIHRDIKPSNIIVAHDRVPKLCDFGLAKDLTLDPRLTTVGTVMGTPCYISPEQVDGAPVDIRSDIYSLGATLYHCVCGEAPFSDASGEAVLLKHLTEYPTPIRRRRPGFSQVVGEIINRMLRKDPAERFQTPRELRRILKPLAFEESLLWGDDSQNPS
jgi:serine/threonine protein kinase